MQADIDAVSAGVPAALTKLITLGRTWKTRAPDVLAYFDPPGTSNGPTEAINGRLEHLRGSAQPSAATELAHSSSSPSRVGSHCGALYCQLVIAAP